MKTILATLTLMLTSGCGSLAYAQAKPTLSTAEKTAISDIVDKLKENETQERNLAQQKANLMATVSQIAAEFSKNHPGFHLDPNTAEPTADPVKAAQKK